MAKTGGDRYAQRRNAMVLMVSGEIAKRPKEDWAEEVSALVLSLVINLTRDPEEGRLLLAALQETLAAVKQVDD